MAMVSLHHTSQLIRTGLSLSTLLPLVLLASPAALAGALSQPQSSKPASFSEKPNTSSVAFGRVGAPTRRRGAGSRGNCNPQLNHQSLVKQDAAKATQTVDLVAIAPNDAPLVTTDAKPSLLFYLGEMAGNRDVEWILMDDQGQVIHSKLLTVPGQAGIIRLDLASFSDAPELATQSNYHWYISLICNSADRAKDIVVEGNLQRIPPLAAPTTTGQAASNHSSSMSQVIAQFNAGHWHDAMVQLNQLRQTADDAQQQALAQRHWQRILDEHPELLPPTGKAVQNLSWVAISDISLDEDD